MEYLERITSYEILFWLVFINVNFEAIKLKPLKIAVNTRLLLKNKMEGIGWFTYETLSRITKSHPEVEFVFFFDRTYDKSFIFSDNVEPVVVFPQARHPVLYYTWFHIMIPRLLKKYQPDLFFSPDGYLPLKTNTPTLPVYHDLNFEHYPEDLPAAERFYYRRYFPKYAHRATRIATVSEYSKMDIIDKYGVAAEKIDVVYNGVNPAFQPIENQHQEKVRQQHTSGKPYFLFAGALHPRKNPVNLFKAFELFKQETQAPHLLALAGNLKWWTAPIKKAYEENRFKKDIALLGRQPFIDLQKLVASAEALTYISYFEGFGIPIVEAFQAGTPVITSNITSMPEVAGDAALLIDPFNPESIAEAMKKIYNDDTLKQEMILKGKKRAARFSWEKTAEQLWESMMKTTKL